MEAFPAQRYTWLLKEDDAVCFRLRKAHLLLTVSHLLSDFPKAMGFEAKVYYLERLKLYETEKPYMVAFEMPANAGSTTNHSSLCKCT